MWNFVIRLPDSFLTTVKILTRLEFAQQYLYQLTYIAFSSENCGSRKNETCRRVCPAAVVRRTKREKLSAPRKRETYFETDIYNSLVEVVTMQLELCAFMLELASFGRRHFGNSYQGVV